MESRDYFGTSVSVAGRYVAVGAPTLEGAGSAYVFWLNHTPTVTDDAVTTDEDVSVVVDVLANDLDEDGDALTLTIAAQPDEGVASVTADGEVEYVPSSGFVGQTSFEYQLEDEFGATSNATVTVTVEKAQDTPDAGHSDTDLADTGSPDTGEVDAGSSDVGHADARLDDDATKSPEGCSCTSIDGNDSPGGAVAGLLVLLLGGWVRRTRRR